MQNTSYFLNSTTHPKVNMVKQQIQPWNVTDPKVLAALLSLPREAFVPQKYRVFAFTDWMIPLSPLSRGEKMLTPSLEGKLLQALNLSKQDRVLEVGTGSGYFSALLGKLAKEVLSVDIYRDFSDEAALNAVSHGVNNVYFETGDASQSWEVKHPKFVGTQFDAIVITGALSSFPEAYKALLAEGGRMVAIIGEAPSMQVIRVTRDKGSLSEFRQESLFDTVVPLLKKSIRQPVFSF
jgi:protein-L-isoaspartate(D-aspartate) O-methyltransferase